MRNEQNAQSAQYDSGYYYQVKVDRVSRETVKGVLLTTEHSGQEHEQWFPKVALRKDGERYYAAGWLLNRNNCQLPVRVTHPVDGDTLPKWPEPKPSQEPSKVDGGDWWNTPSTTQANQGGQDSNLNQPPPGFTF